MNEYVDFNVSREVMEAIISATSISNELLEPEVSTLDILIASLTFPDTRIFEFLEENNEDEYLNAETLLTVIMGIKEKYEKLFGYGSYVNFIKLKKLTSMTTNIQFRDINGKKFTNITTFRLDYSVHLKYTPELEEALIMADKMDKEMGRKSIKLDTLIYCMLINKESKANILLSCFFKTKGLMKYLKDGLAIDKVIHNRLDNLPKEMKQFVTNLNLKFSNKSQCDILGRDDEIFQVWNIISKKTKRNAVLIGEPGVGKTAIVEAITCSIINKTCPKEFEDYKGFDHAEYGIKVLFEDGWIRKFIKDDQYDDIIYKAIINHNKYKIEEGLNEEELLNDVADYIETLGEYTYNNPYIPNGFIHTEGKWNNGYTIKGVTQNVNDEFVWVPCVLTEAEQQVAQSNGHTVQIFQKKLDYPKNSGLEVTGDEPEADDIRTSVENYQGFYIAKYEAGIPGTTQSVTSNHYTSVAGDILPVSQPNVGVWNYINRTNALALSKKMINYEKTGVHSTLISGAAWDTTLQWITNTTDASYAEDSTGKGNYSGSIAVTSSNLNTAYAKNNIYDMAGNVREWTTENCTYNGYSGLVNRGRRLHR